MKRTAIALITLIVALCPLAAAESWIGITTGPSFDIQKNGDEPVFTDFGWDVNVEGAYYFDQAETLGLGLKLGAGFNYGSTYSIDMADMAPSLVNGMLSDLPPEYLSKILQTVDATVDFPVVKNPSAGIKIAPAVTFQYRLAVTYSLSLRLGAGVQYIHTFGQGMNETVDLRALKSALAQSGLASAHAGESIPDSLSIKSSVSLDAIEIIANADVVYSLGDIQIFGGVDLGFTVMTYMKQTTEIAELGMKTSEGEFITDGFGFSITPRVGVSYAF